MKKLFVILLETLLGIIVLFGLLIFLQPYINNALNPEPVSEEYMKKFLKKESFDKEIMTNITQYEELKLFLETNADTLIGTAKAMSLADFKESQKEHKEESIVGYQKATSFKLLIDGDGKLSTNNIPQFLSEKLSIIVRKIKLPLGVYIDKNITINMLIKSRSFKIDSTNFMSSDIIIGHNLIWNYTKDNLSSKNDISKDTILNKKVLYQIYTREYTND